jgi:hypothetical protein
MLKVGESLWAGARCRRFTGLGSSDIAAALAEKDDLMLFFTLLHAGKGYLHHEGNPLEQTQLLRLLMLGVKLQADDCVAQCAAELGAKARDLETALTVVEAAPAEVEAYPEIKTLREHAWSTFRKHVEVSKACVSRDNAVGGAEARTNRRIPSGRSRTGRRWPWCSTWGRCTSCGQGAQHSLLIAKTRMWAPGYQTGLRSVMHSCSPRIVRSHGC